MTGLIWFVQLVHYPLFLEVPETAFPRYESLHQKKTGWVVIPLMTIELLLSLYLLFSVPFDSWNVTQGTILFAILLSTFFIQRPLHMQIAQEKDQATINRLVQTNWIRTLLWSLRSFILFRMAVA